MKGSYILLIRLGEENDIEVGKLGNIKFKAEYYLYIGSALNGIEQRVSRHLRSDKKTHWHIDYLLEKAEIIHVFYKENDKREECEIAQIFFDKFENIPGFGGSDCNCKSHLLYGKKIEIMEVISSLALKQY